MSKEAREKVGLDANAREKLRQCVEAFAACRFGAAGPPVETTFAEIEGFGHDVGRMVAQELEEHLTREHAGHFQQEASCPGCGALCKPQAEPVRRGVQTRDGEVPLQEPVCHCPVCNRDFFPSARGVEN